jgi:hypothetical protein
MHLFFVTMIVGLPVGGIEQHRFLKRFADLRESMARPPIKQLSLNCSQRKKRFSKGKG